MDLTIIKVCQNKALYNPKSYEGFFLKKTSIFLDFWEFLRKYQAFEKKSAQNGPTTIFPSEMDAKKNYDKSLCRTFTLQPDDPKDLLNRYVKSSWEIFLWKLKHNNLFLRTETGTITHKYSWIKLTPYRIPFQDMDSDDDENVLTERMVNEFKKILSLYIDFLQKEKFNKLKKLRESQVI